MRRRRWLGLAAAAAAAVAVAAVAAAWPGTARAQAGGGDEALIREGVELRRHSRDEEALEKFRAAYRVRATPRARAQMGLAEQALGSWVAAARDLEGALAAAHDGWIVTNAATLRRALGVVEQHVGKLQVLGGPARASVKIDGQDAGELPMSEPERVPAGEVVVSVAAPGHIPITRKVTIQPGTITRETIVLSAADLAPQPAAANGAPAPAAPRRRAVATVSSEPDADVAPASAPSSGVARGAAWVTLGLAGASLAFAIVENMSYLNKRGDFDDGVAAGPCGTGLAGRGAAGCAALYEDMNGAKTASIIGFAATGVLGAGSALLFILAPPATPERRIACAPQGTGVGCRLSF